MKSSPFHLSLPCKSISETRNFYMDILGAKEGRSTSGWIDVDLLGNQITFTKSGPFQFQVKSYKFEDTILPSFHFGVIVNDDIWQKIYKRLNSKDVEFTAALTFLEGKRGQHKSFFVTDPNGHTVEFKCFAEAAGIFDQ